METFTSENTADSSLPVVDTDNPDPLRLKKVTDPYLPLLQQQTLSTSNQTKDLSVYEIDVDKVIDKFIKVMNQFGEKLHWMKESAECLEQQSEKAVKMQ